MSIIGNAYKLPNCPSTISRHDTRVYNCGRIDASAAYPLCRDILASVSAEHGAGDSLEECHNRDVLFGFVIRGHLIGLRVTVDYPMITSLIASYVSGSTIGRV